VEAAVNLAHGLEMNVVAEGVEDATSYDFLSGLGCDIAQGYFISHPIPASQVLAWHEANNGRLLNAH
jgi:EAL domain-containing protein (putative c-di-GMP-specific phosphodiesterase class I)